MPFDYGSLPLIIVQLSLEHLMGNALVYLCWLTLHSEIKHLYPRMHYDNRNCHFLHSNNGLFYWTDFRGVTIDSAGNAAALGPLGSGRKGGWGGGGW